MTMLEAMLCFEELQERAKQSGLTLSFHDGKAYIGFSLDNVNTNGISIAGYSCSLPSCSYDAILSCIVMWDSFKLHCDLKK